MNTCSTCRWFRPGDPTAKRLSARWPTCALMGLPVVSSMQGCELWKSEYSPSPEISRLVKEIKAAKDV